MNRARHVVHHRRPLAGHRFAAAWLSAGVLVLAGCASTSATDPLEASLVEYDAGEYAQAHTHATEVMESSDGTTRDAAAYVGGLSAYRLGDRAEAERLLLEAAAASDEATGAKAKAVLGLLRLDQHRPREAVALFEAAAPHLSDEDRAKVIRYAAAPARRTGLDEQAVVSALSSESPAGAAHDRAAFALQIGAFEDRRRAKRAAADVRPLALRTGLGEPRVTTRRGHQGVLYLVQIGAFDSRQDAAAQRASIGRPEYIVASRAD